MELSKKINRIKMKKKEIIKEKDSGEDRMSFVGVITVNKEFDFIKNIVNKKFGKKLKVLNINVKNVENIKNVRFETVVVCKNLNEFKNQFDNLNHIMKNAKYIIINTDIDLNKDVFYNINSNIITFGLNSKATFTVSSIEDEKILICLQRNIKDVLNNIIEPYEININFFKNSSKNLYNYMIIYSIYAIYSIKNE